MLTNSPPEGILITVADSRTKVEIFSPGGGKTVMGIIIRHRKQQPSKQVKSKTPVLIALHALFKIGNFPFTSDLNENIEKSSTASRPLP